MNTYPILRKRLLPGALLLALCAGQPLLAAAETPSSGIRWQAPVTVATGPAHIGPWRMNDSEFHYVDDATVALRADGTAVVVWVDNERQDVFLQRYDADNKPLLAEPVNVSRSPAIFSWLPRVVLTDDDQVYVLWQEIVFSGGSHGGEIFFARSGDGGSSFSEPLNLSNTTAGAGKGRLTRTRWDNGSLDIALGSDGELLVAWSEYQGALHLRRSTDGGRSFSEARHISGSDRQPARAPSLAAGPEGRVYLAWTTGDDPAADIRLAISPDRGRSFGAARAVVPGSGHSDNPALAVDRQGRVHLVYTQRPDGPLTAPYVGYLQLDRHGHSLIEARALSPYPNPGTEGARAASIGLDGRGGIFIVWEHLPHVGRRGSGLGFVHSGDGGQSFSPPRVIPGSQDARGADNGYRQGQLTRRLSVNQHGAIAVANSHLLAGEESRILWIRGH